MKNKHKGTKFYFKPTDFSVSNNNANLLIKTATGICTMNTNEFWQEKKIQIYKYKKADTHTKIIKKFVPKKMQIIINIPLLRRQRDSRTAKTVRHQDYYGIHTNEP